MNRLAKFTLGMFGAGAMLLSTYSYHKLTVLDYEVKVSTLSTELQNCQRVLSIAEETLHIIQSPITYERTAAPLYDIALSQELQTFTYDMCRLYGIEEHYELILAVMWHESNFDAAAISSTDDYGLMQINKCNHKEPREILGVVDFLDPESSITCGVHIFSNILRKYDDYNQVLMVYNMGQSGAARAWGRGIYKSVYSSEVLLKLEKIYKE
jgi:soluble lytic murein transglycosylase-like protein